MVGFFDLVIATLVVFLLSGILLVSGLGLGKSILQTFEFASW